MKVPDHLKMRPEEEDIKEWCLVRYNTCAGDDEVNVSGPLAISSAAPGYLGFIRGYIGAELLTFDTEEEAQAFLDGSPGQSPAAFDIPELVADQMLRVEVYSHWDSSLTVVYEGNDLLKVRSAFLEQVGLKKVTKNNYAAPRITVVREHYAERCKTAKERCKTKPEDPEAREEVLRSLPYRSMG